MDDRAPGEEPGNRAGGATPSHASSRDPLTGLPYRAGFIAGLQRALGSPRQPGRDVLVMLVDVESFTEINHLLGRPRADVILVTLADRLLHCVREDDSVARIGGDEFGIICQGSRLRSARASLRARIEEAFAQPISFKEGDLVVDAAIAAVIAEEGDNEPEPLIARAEAALRAESPGRSWLAPWGTTS